MKREDLFEAIGHVDEDLLDEDVTPAEPVIWRYVAGITTAAACVAVILGTAAFAKFHQQRPPVQTMPDVTTESDTTAPEETEETPTETEAVTDAVIIVTSVVNDAPETTALLTTETQESTEVSTTASEAVETTVATATEAVTEPTEIRDWKSAYRNVVETGEFNNDFTKEQLGYELTDIDGDGTPELIVNVEGYLMFMYTYADGETYTLMDGWVYGAGGNAGYQWIAGENKLYNHNSDYAGLIQYNTYMKIGADHQLETVNVIRANFFNDTNGNGEIDDDIEEELTPHENMEATYYLNESTVPISAEEAAPYFADAERYRGFGDSGNAVDYKGILTELQ